MWVILGIISLMSYLNSRVILIYSYHFLFHKILMDTIKFIIFSA